MWVGMKGVGMLKTCDRASDTACVIEHETASDMLMSDTPSDQAFSVSALLWRWQQ